MGAGPLVQKLEAKTQKVIDYNYVLPKKPPKQHFINFNQLFLYIFWGGGLVHNAMDNRQNR